MLTGYQYANRFIDIWYIHIIDEYLRWKKQKKIFWKKNSIIKRNELLSENGRSLASSLRKLINLPYILLPLSLSFAVYFVTFVWIYYYYTNKKNNVTIYYWILHPYVYILCAPIRFGAQRDNQKTTDMRVMWIVEFVFIFIICTVLRYILIYYSIKVILCSLCVG